MSNSDKAFLEIRGLCKRLGRIEVLNQLDWSLNHGERAALIGRSGCGKSTLLRLIAGLDEPDAGSITVRKNPRPGNADSTAPGAGQTISLLFQDLGLWPNLSIASNIALGLSGQSLSKSERNDIVSEFAERLELQDTLRRKPGAISLGQQQRVAIARAFIGRPSLLLLDEPFAGLDLETKDNVQSWLRLLLDETKAALVLVTHDPQEAAALHCPHLALLEDGRIISTDWAAMDQAEPESAIINTWKRHSGETPTPKKRNQNLS